MESDELAVGLDIGSSKITSVVGAYEDDGTFEILGLGVSKKGGVRCGKIVNIAATQNAIEEAVEEAQDEAALDIFYLTIGIGGDHIRCNNTKAVARVNGRYNEISQDDINRVLDNARALVLPMEREMLHFIPQEFEVDDQVGIQNPLNMSGQKLVAKAHIISGALGAKQDLSTCINRASFEVRQIIVNALAAAKVVLKEDEKELGVMMIDIGAGTSDVLVYVDGSPFFTGVFPYGSDIITNDIALSCAVTKQKAEELKLNCSSAHADSISETSVINIPIQGKEELVPIYEKEFASRIIEPRIKELLEIIRVQMIREHLWEKINGGVVLTGGGANLPGIDKIAEKLYEKPVRIGFPLKCKAKNPDWISPEYAVAIGLASLSVNFDLEHIEHDGGYLSKGGEGKINSVGKWIKKLFTDIFT